MIQGVIFDMDGLMFDTEAAMLRGWLKAGEVMHYDIREELVLSVMGLVEEKIRQTFMEQLGADFPYEKVRDFQMSCVDEEMDMQGVPVKKGLFELLEYLKESGIKTAVATSTARSRAEKLLTLSGAMPYFDSVICGDMVRCGKPDPDIYLQSAKALGLAPQDCIGLEDSRNGIFAVYNAGMKAVMIPDLIQPDEEMKAKIYRKLNDLSQVIELIKAESD
uniref:Hydrolase n=1 Tax=uncultured Bacillota bacterium TaxID=344338 RepID=A0A650EMV9_9FIRM|nr:hydrolase [uncultured Firmicutes bacterium]